MTTQRPFVFEHCVAHFASYWPGVLHGALLNEHTAKYEVSESHAKCIQRWTEKFDKVRGTITIALSLTPSRHFFCRIAMILNIIAKRMHARGGMRREEGRKMAVEQQVGTSGLSEPVSSSPFPSK